MKNPEPIFKRHPNFLLVEEPGAPGDPSNGILPGTREATPLEYLLRDEDDRWRRDGYSGTPKWVAEMIVKTKNSGYALTEACLQMIRDQYHRDIESQLINDRKAA